MKLYLSSYKFGDQPNRLVSLFGGNKKIALISNSLDFSNDLERLEKQQKEQLEGLSNLGLDPEAIDLRDYFDKKGTLEQKLEEFAGVWVRGGNVFVLRVAYKLSGFDEIVKGYVETHDDFVYSGFSAGCCILSPDLKGFELVDDSKLVESAYQHEVVREGLGLIDYAFIPHYKSDHPESESIDKVVEWYKNKGLEYKTLRDGEAIIYEDLRTLRS